MSSFSFNKDSAAPQQHTSITEGVHATVITQVADIGLQKAYDPENPPEAQFAVSFELVMGETITKRMKFSDHPMSNCYAIFTSAFPELLESGHGERDLSNLLGKSVLIEIEIHDSKWPRITAIMPLEDGFSPVTPKGDLLEFDANNMDRDVYTKLHRDIRSLVAKRIRHATTEQEV
jgi:hypothetical protein